MRGYPSSYTHQHNVWEGATSALWPIVQGSPSVEQSATKYVIYFVDWLRDIRHFSHQHLNVASHRIKAHADVKHLANSTGFHKKYKSGYTLQPRPQGSHLSSSHPQKACTRYHQDPETSKDRDEGGTVGQTAVLPRDNLGQAALRKEW
jgi:hypothetical protein